MLFKLIRMVLLVILAFSIFKPIDILQYENFLKSELEVCSVSYAAEKNDSDKVITEDTVKQMSDTELKEALEKATDENTLYSVFHSLGYFVSGVFLLCLVLLIPSIFVGGIYIVGMGAIISLVAAIFLGIACAVVEPDSVRIIDDEIQAREEIKDNEKKLAEKYQKRDEEINKLTGQYKALFDESYHKYIAAGQNEDEAKDNALADVKVVQKNQENQKKSTEESKQVESNPYLKYDESSPEITSAIFAFTYEHMPKAYRFIDERKELPFEGIIDMYQMKELYDKGELKRLGTRWIMFGKNPYVLKEDGEYYYYGKTWVDQPWGAGAIFKLDKSKTFFRPVYIGNFVEGRYSGYGIEFYDEKGANDGTLRSMNCPKYDGYFSDGYYYGKGNYYSVGGLTMGGLLDALPDTFVVYSGEFKRDEKEGDFIVYRGLKECHEKYDDDKKVK